MARQSKPAVPAYDEMLVPTVDALRELGGSGSIEEIDSKVISLMSLSSGVLDVIHANSSVSEVSYRLAWSRTYLKKFGLIENSSRGVWSLTAKGTAAKKLDPKEIVRFVREQSRADRSSVAAEPEIDPYVDEEHREELEWHQRYLNLLLALDPKVFERLVQRMLRESGFVRVEVTGQSGDGGIDGIGIARINGFLSFQVLFQCKRYQGSVTPSQIRDFRGAMQGRTEKGLFVTTGSFTRDAIREATRDGAPPIDLINGEELVRKLKELGLGVKITMVESVEVDHAWFEHL